MSMAISDNFESFHLSGGYLHWDSQCTELEYQEAKHSKHVRQFISPIIRY